MSLSYQLEPDLSASDFAGVLHGSGLAARRPAEDLPRLDAMLRGSQLVVTARDDTALVGVARSITDWAYVLYCADLCVDKGWQGRGVGRELLRRTAAMVPDVRTCLLLSAPGAVSFYEKAGFDRLDVAFVFNRRD